MLSIIYCETCKSFIEKKGAIHGLYEIICESYVDDRHPCVFTDADNKIKTMVEFLERNQYVVTTECGDSNIKVKPLGVEFSESECLICPCYHQYGDSAQTGE